MQGVTLRFALLVMGTLLCACVEEDPCVTPVVGSVCAVAGTGELGFNRDGLRPTETDFYLLSAVRRAPDGRLFLMDFNNQRMRVIGSDGLVQTLMGSGFHAAAALGEDALDSPLENPVDFDFLPDGRLVFVSYHDPRVLVLERDGTIGRLAGSGEIGLRGNEGDYEPALDALFIQLDGIAVAPDGDIYVSDSLAHRVRVVRAGIVAPVAGTGNEEYLGDGGPAVDAALFAPTALTFDREGRLLIADTRNHAVRRIDADGTIRTIAGNGTQGFSGDGGAASAAMLDQPNGLAVDLDGTLYIADRGNFRIRRVRPDGVIETMAGVGVEGRSGDGGPALAARFGYVARLALDDGMLLIADQSNACARRIRIR